MRDQIETMNKLKHPMKQPMKQSMKELLNQSMKQPMEQLKKQRMKQSMQLLYFAITKGKRPMTQQQHPPCSPIMMGR